MKPRVKLYLCDDKSKGTFGDGRWRLLRAIADEGSIRAAARRLGRGYRKAWGDIEHAERAFGRPLVERSRGGVEGGSAALTDFGRRILEGWELCHRAAEVCLEREFERHLRCVIEEPYDGSGRRECGRPNEEEPERAGCAKNAKRQQEVKIMNIESRGRLIEASALEKDGVKTLTCAAAFELSKRHGIALREIGAYCNEHGIRIRACQLGCFE